MSDQDHPDRFDPRVRELTYRLMGMAPDAPPFPEEATMKVPETKQRQPAFVWAAAVAAVVLLVGLPLFLFRGGDGTTDPATTIAAAESTTTTVDAPTTTVSGEPTTTIPPSEGFVRNEFAVYLFADDMTTPVGDPALVPVSRFQDHDGNAELPVGERISDALDHLWSAESGDGYSTSIPEGIQDFTVSVGGNQPANVVSVDLPAEFEAGGGTMAMTTRLAQVVFTATQFEGVDSVLFLIDGEVVDVFSGEGLVLDGEPQTREDYVDILPLIFLDSPAIGSDVSSPVMLSGVANAFEATVLYEIVDMAGNGLASGFTTASCGTGCWGDFSVDVGYNLAEETQGEVVVYEESARDGSRVNELRYPVTLLPTDSGAVPTTTIPPSEPTPTSLPGETFDIGPAEGDVVAVIGVAHDDVLFLRDGPGVGYEPMRELSPLADDLVATGRHRLLESSIWSEVTAQGFTGWVNSRFIGYLGTVDDLTSLVVDQLGGIPEAETMLVLGTTIAESFDPGESGFRYEMAAWPTGGDLFEVTFDVIGLLDDSQLGWRLHIFGQPTENGEGFSLKSIEATALCGRGVTAEGFCV